MKGSRTTPPKQLSATAYILISAAGFFLSLLCVYYYLHYVEGNVTEQVSQKIFYIVLIIFGISASALIFGAMNSYGVLTGEHLATKFHLTGPVVGVILVVVGGFYLPKGAARQTLSITAVNEQHIPVARGKVTIYFPHYTREQSFDNNGQAVFSDINEDELTGKIKFDITSDGYSRLTFDTLIKTFASIQITLSQMRVIHISGKVITAAESPITDVVLMVDGTRFYSKSITDGSYSFEITGYSIGDQVNLVTSHKNYVDKTKTLKIDRQEMTGIDFVLQPLKP
jgi:hypothetical protein